MTQARPAPRNPPPFQRRAFLHLKVEVQGTRFEIHPDGTLHGRPRVYRRDQRGALRRVKDPGLVTMVLQEYDRQHATAQATKEAAAKREATRKPPVMRKPSLRWRLRRWLKRAVQRIRDRISSWRTA